MNIHDEEERERMKEKRAKWIIVLDQGSRSGRPVVDSGDEGIEGGKPKGVRCLIVDHHLSDEFPDGAEVSDLLASKIDLCF